MLRGLAGSGEILAVWPWRQRMKLLLQFVTHDAVFELVPANDLDLHVMAS